MLDVLMRGYFSGGFFNAWARHFWNESCLLSVILSNLQGLPTLVISCLLLLRHVVFSAIVAVCLIDSGLCFCMPLRPLPSKLLISCKARKSMLMRHRPCAHPIAHAHTKRRVRPVLEWTWHGVIIVEPE